MREIRIYELEHDEPAQAWRLAQPLALHVTEGELWLTIDGDAGDYWLRVGESIALPARARLWVSAGRAGVRFMLAQGGASASSASSAFSSERAPLAEPGRVHSRAKERWALRWRLGSRPA